MVYFERKFKVFWMEFKMRPSTLLMGLAFLMTSTLSSLAANPPIPSQPAVSQHPNVHQINVRLRGQWILLQQGVRSGKLTKDQVASIRTGLKSLRVQEINFFKQNGKHELSSDQQSQLNAQLDKYSKALGEPAPASQN